MTCIAVVDIETTGFMPDGKIVEIGIVELCIETGEITPLYNRLVKEEGFGEQDRNSWIFSNSDLTFEEVNNAEPLKIEALQRIFTKYKATAYNKRFDFDFLTSRGLAIDELECPMCLATDVVKARNKNGRIKWPKFQEAYDFLFDNDTGYIEKHRGLDDAYREAEVVYGLIEMGIFKVPGSEE